MKEVITITVSLKVLLASLLLTACCEPSLQGAEQLRQQSQNRPNILWITIEDWSPDLSCYGTKGIHTPHVDKLASEGIRYETAFTTSPVCSASRSATMTGFHQNYIGANQHREHDKKPLPHGVKPIPHLLEEAGYFTALMSWKTDCNFMPNKKEELFMGEGSRALGAVCFSGTWQGYCPARDHPFEEKEEKREV